MVTRKTVEARTRSLWTVTYTECSASECLVRLTRTASMMSIVVVLAVAKMLLQTLLTTIVNRISVG